MEYASAPGKVNELAAKVQDLEQKCENVEQMLRERIGSSADTKK